MNYDNLISFGFYHSRTDGETIGLTHDDFTDYEFIVEPSYINDDTMTVYSMYFGEDEEEFMLDTEVEDEDELIDVLTDFIKDLQNN